ncbi:hypothetical protein SAMN02983003_3638 [Devosia enhydra]|uniref:Uncharacterized protein n=1 Tax=Devosia enhydra TaxID=665118 RepID=A0A1K2I298_9HYPH|nr:hypothetical protein [Devosia enhydra]SFZ86456.1 hypothetical protein SAMN02983003_3638 [Devosia enhydra]
MQHSYPAPQTGKPTAIEVDGEPLGVVLPSDKGFRFLAVRFNAFAIDGQTFASIEDARSAASRAIGGAEIAP